MNLRLVELATFLWGHMLFGAVLACMAAAARFWLASAVLWRGGALTRRLCVMGRAVQANDGRARRSDDWLGAEKALPEDR